MTTRMVSYVEQFDPYRVTTHGANPWTTEALHNVVMLHRHYDASMVAIEGTLNSGYRSVRVNKIVGGAATSRHMRGLACDIKPSIVWTSSSAAAELWRLARSGLLGVVQQIIDEERWVHVGWYAVGEQDAGMSLLRKRGGKYETLEKWLT